MGYIILDGKEFPDVTRSQFAIKQSNEVFVAPYVDMTGFLQQSQVVAGSNVTVVPSGNKIIISSTGGGGGTGTTGISVAKFNAYTGVTAPSQFVDKTRFNAYSGTTILQGANTLTQDFNLNGSGVETVEIGTNAGRINTFNAKTNNTVQLEVYADGGDEVGSVIITPSSTSISSNRFGSDTELMIMGQGLDTNYGVSFYTSTGNYPTLADMRLNLLNQATQMFLVTPNASNVFSMDESGLNYTFQTGGTSNNVGILSFASDAAAFGHRGLSGFVMNPFGTSFTNKVIFQGSSTAHASMNIATGTGSPTAPSTGDIWVSNQNKILYRTTGGTIQLDTFTGISGNLLSSITKRKIALKNLLAGSNVVLTSTATGITITASGGSSAYIVSKSITGVSYNLISSDLGKLLLCTNVLGTSITLPSGLTSGFNCSIVKYNGTGGTIVLNAGSGSVLNAEQNTIYVNYTGADVIKINSTTWGAFGSLGTAVTGSTGVGTITGATNLSGGLGLYTTTASNRLNFKGLLAGQNIAITSSANTLNFSVTGLSNTYLKLSNFNTYSGTTVPAIYLSKTAFATFSGVSGVLQTRYLGIPAFNTFTGTTGVLQTRYLKTLNFGVFSGTSGVLQTRYPKKTDFILFSGSTAPATYQTKTSIQVLTGTTLPNSYASKNANALFYYQNFI